MPSKKPIIHFNTDQWIIDKMKRIAEDNSRSLAKEMEYLCKQRIKAYEAENGEIVIEEPKSIKAIKDFAKMATDKSVPVTERMKKSYTTGFNIGAGKKDIEEE